MPQKSFQNDLHRLFDAIQFFKPSTLLINGDLFHSSYNKEIDYFFQWRQYIADLPVVLVKGNHDRFPVRLYEQENIEVHTETWCRRQFCFAHDLATVDTDLYLFSGHIHPSVKIHGAGRQSLRLPCFYFGSDYAILPAFGNFTGTATLKAGENDVVFAITNQAVISV